MSRPSVAFFGAGKLAVGLSRALAKAGARVSVRAFRDGLPPRPWDVDLLILALRENQLAGAAKDLADQGLVSARTAVVHVAGALPSSVLAPLRGHCAGVAKMHPMIAFASTKVTPTIAGGHAHVEGDPEAVKRARAIAGLVGLRPRALPGLDPIAYHAAAGLVANGATALAAAGHDILVAAGIPAETTRYLLGPLLRSVADNVEGLGLPEALTGPVRRGDAAGLARHLDTLARLADHALPLYRAMGLAQLPLARALGDAEPAAFDRIEQLLRP